MEAKPRFLSLLWHPIRLEIYDAFACHSGFDSLKSLCCILVPPSLVELGQICSGFIKSLTVGTVGSDTVRVWHRTPTLFPSHFETQSENCNHYPQRTRPLVLSRPIIVKQESIHLLHVKVPQVWVLRGVVAE